MKNLQITASYREEEDSQFSHDGQEYNINRLLEAIEKAHLPLSTFQVKDLAWIVSGGSPDSNRVAHADVTTPIIVTEWEDGEKIRLATIDGYHRLHRAIKDGDKTLNGYLVSPEILAKALIPKS